MLTLCADSGSESDDSMEDSAFNGTGRLGVLNVYQTRERASWPSNPVTLGLDARQRHSENFRRCVCDLCIQVWQKADGPQLPPEMAKAVGEAARHDARSTLAPLEAGFFGGPVQDNAEWGPAEDRVRRSCVKNLNVLFRSSLRRCVGIQVESLLSTRAA